MLGCKKLGVTLKNQAHNKINCIHVLIFQVNFIMNLLVRAISDMLEHLLCQLLYELKLEHIFQSILYKRSVKKSPNILNLKIDRTRNCTEK